MDNTLSLLDQYRQVLQRLAWRIQYRARKQIKNEILWLDSEYSQYYQNGVYDSLGDIEINELIATIKSEKGRYIIKRIYIDGLREKEVAVELHISQQAVSKWKKKSLENMKQHMKQQSP